MVVEVRKKARESISAMLRRFNRKVQLSGILLEARKSRFREKRKNRNLRRKDALYRQRIKKERERLEKMGLLK